MTLLRAFVAWTAGLAVAIAVLSVSVSGPREVPVNVEGRSVFLSRCAACHASEPNVPGKLGPSLWGLNAVAGKRVQGSNAAQYVLASIRDPSEYVVTGFPAAMPKAAGDQLSEPRLRDLVAYVLSLGGPPPLNEIAALSIPEAAASAPTVSIEPEEMALGRDVFFNRGQCAACHMPHPHWQDDSRAPPIFGLAISEDRLRQGIERPPETAQARYRAVRVTLKEPPSLSVASAGLVGQPADASVEGILVEQSNSQIVLLELSDGRLRERTFAVSEIAQREGVPAVENLGHSLKPRDYTTRLSTQERDALVKVLSLLN